MDITNQSEYQRVKVKEIRDKLNEFDDEDCVTVSVICKRDGDPVQATLIVEKAQGYHHYDICKWPLMGDQ